MVYGGRDGGNAERSKDAVRPKPVFFVSMLHRHLHRTYIPGGIYFVTTNVRERRPFLTDRENATIVEETIWWSRKIHRCVLYAYVIMPDHLHMLVRPTRTNISQIMHAVKINSSRDIHRGMHSQGIDTSAMENWFQWQQSFYDRVITDNLDFRNHVEYIRYNPVRAGLCTKPENYPFLFVDTDAINRAMGL